MMLKYYYVSFSNISPRSAHYRFTIRCTIADIIAEITIATLSLLLGGHVTITGNRYRWTQPIAIPIPIILLHIL
jgi:hypothetical protein